MIKSKSKEYMSVNPQEREPVQPKNRILNSVFFLVFLPNKVFPYWNFIIFLINYFVWAFLTEILSFFWITYTLPTFDTFFINTVWGFGFFFVASILITSVTNRATSLGTLLLAKNTAVTFSANLTSLFNCAKQRQAFDKALNFTLAYLYLIKNVNRTEDIKIDKLPLTNEEKVEVSNYSCLTEYLVIPYHCDMENGLCIKQIDKFPIRTDARWTLTKGDLYLEAVYNIIKNYLAQVVNDVKIDDVTSASLNAAIGDINTKIDQINSISISGFPTFLIEILVYVSYGPMILIAPIFFQKYALWWGLFFYMFLFLIVFGIILISEKLIDPFEDPDVNAFNSFGKNAGRIIDEGAAAIRYHQKQGIKKFQSINLYQ